MEEVHLISPSEVPPFGAKRLDFAVAITLLGGLMVLCGLLYLVNNFTCEVRHSAWSKVLCIVAASTAMSSHAALDFVKCQFWKEHSYQHWTCFLVDVTNFFIWYLVMHKMIVHRCTGTCVAKVENTCDGKDAYLGFSSCCLLVSHIAAFAAIGAVVQVQTLDAFEGLLQVVFVFAFAIVLRLTFCLADICTARWEHCDEKTFNWIAAEFEDGERTIASVAVSFVAFRAIQHCFLEGWEESDIVQNVAAQTYHYPLKCLLCGGLVFALGSVVYRPRIEAKADEVLLALIQNRLRWWQDIIFHVSIVCSAWLALSAHSWAVSATLLKFGVYTASDSLLQSACVATSASAFGLLAVPLIRGVGNGLADEGGRAIAVILGFTWQQALHGCMIVIAESAQYHGRWFPFCVLFGFAASVAILVTPTWRTLKSDAHFSPRALGIPGQRPAP
eukprot:TRINITY_DN15433_c0_g1_i1.p1 TRINITY_DN15433_c0_g1~~TRINITY_DN15433_c0_g1_i1.p1  ORF type:complete len:507 (+),score=59.89 TRINITY_DN15433_c0_g1_i1:190-1521(+)